MRVIVQRVKASSVKVNGQIIGTIGQGLNLLVGLEDSDTEEKLQWMANKCLKLRLFEQWTRSITDIAGEILVVSQFTLYGDCRKGTRPSFSKAAKPGQAIELYDRFVQILKTSNLNIETGQFGAMMEVEIINDGPVTLILEK